MIFVECSAKNGSNISESFELSATKILDNIANKIVDPMKPDSGIRPGSKSGIPNFYLKSDYDAPKTKACCK